MEKDEIHSFEIEYDAMHHFKNLYELIYRWLDDHGFKDRNIGKDKYEILYFERVKPDETKEHHIWWRAKKQPTSDFFEYWLNIDFQTLYLGSTKIMKEGEKVKTNIGDSIIRAKAILIKDKNDYFEKNRLLNFFKGRYFNKWGKSRIDDAEEELMGLITDLQERIKQYFELNTNKERPEPYYWPAKGV